MMHPIVDTHRRGPRALCVGALFAATALAGSAYAQTTDTQPSARYQADVQACQSGQANQDREACLKEARNALAARQKGELATDEDALQANRLKRCEVQTGEARAACIARMSGRGATSGDVRSGGILREVETVVIKPGAGPVVIEPKTADPVILVPDKR